LTIIRPTTINARFSQPVGLGGEKLWLCPTLGSGLMDLSGEGCHAEYINAEAQVKKGTRGSWSSYFQNNLSYYAQVSNKENFDFLIKTNRFSLAFWVYNKLGSTSGYRYYLGCGIGGSDYGFGLNHAGPSGWGLRFIKHTPLSGNGYSPDLRSYVFPEEEMWVHVASTISDDIAKVYLNGKEIASQAGPFYSVNTGLTNPIVFGKNTYNNASASFGPVDGWMDDIRIYDRTLSAGDIKHLASYRGVLGSPRQPYDPLKRTVVGVPAGIQFKPYWAKQSTQISGLLK